MFYLELSLFNFSKPALFSTPLALTRDPFILPLCIHLSNILNVNSSSYRPCIKGHSLPFNSHL